MNDMKCGCGKPVRYMMGDSFENGACNKYKRCRTYDELEAALRTSRLNEMKYFAALQKIALDADKYSKEGLAAIAREVIIDEEIKKVSNDSN